MNTTRNKVAEVTLLFWSMKIVATTLGETLGDHLSMTLGLGYFTGLLITGLAFALVLFLQLRSTRYTPVVFWTVIIATTTLGTEISDLMDRSLHLGYTLGSAVLLTGLLVTLWLWYRHFGNIEVFPIADRRKELYYWTAILFSNSLGTAFGDYLSDVVGLSYLLGAAVTAGIIVLVMAAHKFTTLNSVLLFWIAFVFTRPFGATFGDFLTKPLDNGGLDLGTLKASIVSVALMGVMIALAHRSQLRAGLATRP